MRVTTVCGGGDVHLVTAESPHYGLRPDSSSQTGMEEIDG